MSFICKLCKLEFKSKYSLNRHIERINSCCNKEELIVRIKTLDDQINLDKNNSTFDCMLCNYNFKTKYTLNRHIGNESIICFNKKELINHIEELEKKVEDIKLLQENHIKSIKIKKPRKNLCNFCKQLFNSDLDLHNHYNNEECESIILNDYYKINKMLSRSFYKKYKMPSGKFVNYQGYENFALDELIMEYNEDDIKNNRNKVPLIKYKLKNKEHSYYPDIFIKSDNKIIEIKSEYTYNMCLIKNILKALSAKKNGYKFEFWIYKIKNNKIESKIVI